MRPKSAVMWLALAAIAPVSWGSNYLVAQLTLPLEFPIFGAALRSAPVGLVLVCVSRYRPSRAQLFRLTVLGVLNVSVFFVLIFVVAARLPSGHGATLMGLFPVIFAALAWLILRERPTYPLLIGCMIAVFGVVLVVSPKVGGIPDIFGVVASLGAMLSSALGFLWGKAWTHDVPALAFAGWQLFVGGIALVPFVGIFEGVPVIDGGALWGYMYIGVISTGVAYVVWFAALDRLPAHKMGMLTLLNPLTGATVGVLLGGEPAGWPYWAGLGLTIGGMAIAVRHQPKVKADAEALLPPQRA